MTWISAFVGALVALPMVVAPGGTGADPDFGENGTNRYA